MDKQSSSSQWSRGKVERHGKVVEKKKGGRGIKDDNGNAISKKNDFKHLKVACNKLIF